jgi:hypothetical protein
MSKKLLIDCLFDSCGLATIYSSSKGPRIVNGRSKERSFVDNV